MKRRLLSLLLGGLLCLSACTPGERGGGETLRIGVAVYKGTDTYITI